MNKLTILLSLRDRSFESKSWLERNFYDYYDYIVADGSLNNYNFNIFSKIKKKNFKYYRFKKDINFKDYYLKVYKTSLKIKTDFVMQVDNDDIINPYGINKCINLLIRNKKINIAGGYISGFNAQQGNLFLSDFNENNCKHLEKNKKYKRLETYLKNYRIIWYSIYRKITFQKAWKNCVDFSCKNVVNTEILHGLSSLAVSKFGFVNNNIYIRRTNPRQSIYKKYNQLDREKEINKLIIFISKKYNLNENLLLNYHKNRDQKYKKRNFFFKIFLYLLRKIPMSFKQIICLNNKFNFID